MPAASSDGRSNWSRSLRRVGTAAGPWGAACFNRSMGRQGVRLDWSEVPASVRRAVDEMLGAPVVTTHQMSGGFSPGPAVRAELADGRVVFVKAAGVDLNVHTPGMHRREAMVLRALPTAVAAPRLIGAVDDGDWVALAIEWVDGRHPDAADGDDVRRVVAVLERLARDTQGTAIDGIDSFADVHRGIYGHWVTLAAEPAAGLDGWSRRHLDRLAELDLLVPQATAGDHLVHTDVRTDNVLVGGRRGDVLVDWPAASIGAPWIDLVGLLPALHLDGGPPPTDVFAASALGRAADPDAVDAVVAAVAGYFTRMALLPPPPGLPTVRAFQAAQGAIARAWAADRLGLR
jgi:hypothetical protein